MSSFADTAFSTNAFSVDAFDFGVGPPEPPEPPQPPAPEPTLPRPSGGYPSDSGPTPEQRRRSRILHGLEAEVVDSVAKRQAEALDLDAIQQQQELEGELRLRGLEAEIAHYEALAAKRQALIDAEIATRMRSLLRQQEDDAAIALILIAASVS